VKFTNNQSDLLTGLELEIDLVSYKCFLKPREHVKHITNTIFVGVAFVRTVCWKSLYHNAAVVRDAGYWNPYTMAHEIGHM